MKRVFVSYASADRQVAGELIAALRHLRGAKMIDAADMPAGAPFERWLRSAIQDSSAIVVLLSPKTLDNSWVAFEIGAGLGLGKQIIPVLMKGQASTIPEPLRELQLLDARNRSTEEIARAIEVALLGAAERAP